MVIILFPFSAVAVSTDSISKTWLFKTNVLFTLTVSISLGNSITKYGFLYKSYFILSVCNVIVKFILFSILVDIPCFIHS